MVPFTNFATIDAIIYSYNRLNDIMYSHYCYKDKLFVAINSK